MDLSFFSRRTALKTCLGLMAAVFMAAVFMTMVATARAAGELRERIFYTSFRPASLELYLFDAPGKAPRRLTPYSGLNYNPVFSPDGRWVVFSSERGGNPDLYAVDLKSPGPPRLLMESAALEDSPDLSPDGRLLAFVGTRDGNAEIFVTPFRPQEPALTIQAANLTRHESGDFSRGQGERTENTTRRGDSG